MTHPTQAVGAATLTDEQIKAIHDRASCLPDMIGARDLWPDILSFARAIERASTATAPSAPTLADPVLIDWNDAHETAYQAAAAFQPSYFDGPGFLAHNWVVEAIRTAHIDGQRFAKGLPKIDRNGALAPEYRRERAAAVGLTDEQREEVLDVLRNTHGLEGDLEEIVDTVAAVLAGRPLFVPAPSAPTDARSAVASDHDPAVCDAAYQSALHEIAALKLKLAEVETKLAAYVDWCDNMNTGPMFFESQGDQS